MQHALHGHKHLTQGKGGAAGMGGHGTEPSCPMTADEAAVNERPPCDSSRRKTQYSCKMSIAALRICLFMLMSSNDAITHLLESI